MFDDWTDQERHEFLKHLEHSGPVEAAVRRGMTIPQYAASWKLRNDDAFGRDRVAAALAAPMPEFGTVRGYLVRFLRDLWLGMADAEDGPTGNSDWRFDAYKALARSGLIPAWDHDYGMTPQEEETAEKLVLAAIDALAGENGVKVVRPEGLTFNQWTRALGDAVQQVSRGTVHVAGPILDVAGPEAVVVSSYPIADDKLSRIIGVTDNL